MITNEITVPAARGADYRLTRDRSLIRLQRATPTGGTLTIVFGLQDAVRVADGLVDLTEAAQ